LNEFIARYEAALAADKARSRKPVTPKWRQLTSWSIRGIL
jgi:hypothetical protein